MCTAAVRAKQDPHKKKTHTHKRIKRMRHAACLPHSGSLWPQPGPATQAHQQAQPAATVTVTHKNEWLRKGRGWGGRRPSSWDAKGQARAKLVATANRGASAGGCDKIIKKHTLPVPPSHLQ
jgi:hypothetical protein